MGKNNLKHLAFGAIAAYGLLDTASVNALDVGKLYNEASRSIVQIELVGESFEVISLGSGIIIAPGEIVTNCHVVDGKAPFIWVRHADISLPHEAKVRYRDQKRDLCQIALVSAVSRRNWQTVPAIADISPVGRVRVGQRVFAIGNPQGLALTLSDGIISALREGPSGTWYQTTAPISPGSSGGGLFDDSGWLIGITSSNKPDGQNLNFAVPAAYILELPKRSLNLAPEIPQRPPTDEEVAQVEQKAKEMLKELDAMKRRLSK